MNIKLVGTRVVDRCEQCVSDTPESRFMFAVWRRGVLDAHQPLPDRDQCSRGTYRLKVRRITEAVRYLASEFAEADLGYSGVRPEYAARVMAEEMTKALILQCPRQPQ